MPSEVTDQQIFDAIQPLLKEGRLACKDALELAEALRLAPIRIGRVCNAREIRITNCRLGCFGIRQGKPK